MCDMDEFGRLTWSEKLIALVGDDDGRRQQNRTGAG